MDSADLFSHRHEPEVVAPTGRSSEAVQLPTFSDRPDSPPPATTRPS